MVNNKYIEIVKIHEFINYMIDVLFTFIINIINLQMYFAQG